MKKAIIFSLLFFLGIAFCGAQETGQIAMGGGTIREDRNQSINDISILNKYSADNPIFIYPNPATDFIWIAIASDRPTLYRATIFDINGTILLHKDWLTETGAHKYYLSLPSGSFAFPLYIRIHGPWNGGDRIFRILKQI
jgi:hypothetical protein